MVGMKRQYMVQGTTFDVDARYDVKKGVGQGAYGLICAAQDSLTDEQVAIKKIADAFDDVVKQWKDVYLVTELMDTDLHYIIHSKQALSDDHVQYFVYQILRGLKAVHSAKVLHRDLKPGNLLVNKNCDLKICDFGLARGVDLSQGGGRNLTEYVVTRWYRAPELLVENESYDEAIDIWSAGCILAEFLGRKALFPGRDYLQQLRLIIETLGTPSDADLSIISNRQAVEYIKAMPKREAVPFEDIFPDASADAIDLLSQMLVFDPRKRITAAAALKHRYLVALHNVNEEPVAEPFDFRFENEKVSEQDLKKLCWQQLLEYHKDLGGRKAYRI